MPHQRFEERFQASGATVDPLRALIGLKVHLDQAGVHLHDPRRPPEHGRIKPWSENGDWHWHHTYRSQTWLAPTSITPIKEESSDEGKWWLTDIGITHIDQTWLEESTKSQAMKGNGDWLTLASHVLIKHG